MQNPSPMIMHSTYFKLKYGSSVDAPKSYMAACREYLSTSKGMMSFWVGELASDIQRPVNDRDFDVAMHQVFQNKDAFDGYNGHDPKHDQFVAEVNRWAPDGARRVFDSSLSLSHFEDSETPAGDADGSRGPRLMHSIYFSLTDKSEESRAGFKDICLKLLSDHDGQCGFAIGECANPLGRTVNVENYDVAVDIQWREKKPYEEYLASQRHKDFPFATAGMIKITQVFSSYLQDEPPAVIAK